MSIELTDKITERFTHALSVLDDAAMFAKSMYQTDVYQEAGRLMETMEGMEILYQYANRFEEAGVFTAGQWEHADKLQPPFVAGSLKSKGLASIIEVLSDLRMLSIAKGNYDHPRMSSDDAWDFLNEVLALNLDLLFLEETELASEQEEQVEQLNRSQRFFQFLFSNISPDELTKTLGDEIERLTAQRPIMVKRIVSMIHMAKKLISNSRSAENGQMELIKYIKAIEGPSPLCEHSTNINDYRNKLKSLSEADLNREAKAFSASMLETGLVSSQHAILVRFLSRTKPELLTIALNLTDRGKANLVERLDLVKQLIKVGIYPATRQAVYGLGKILCNGILSQPPVIPGLRRLIELDIKPEVRKDLLAAYEHRQGLTANTILLSGVISVLGQPLGIGQGLNPTCQSARGISLWAQHAPGYLLELIPRAARDGDIDLKFDGIPIHSKDLAGGLAPELHKELDPVSLILVPHLDRIYNAMMIKVALRGEDGHRWVNPAFYGDWVQNGFSNVIEPITGSVTDFPGFVRLFYATHHPDYNDDYELIYPNPVGIFITTVHGKLLGYHAVSILRIAAAPAGDYRIYFYDPNNESSQNWGQNIEPTVSGNGEREGEFSLPFHEFVARLYAFHYNPYEQGDAFAVDDEVVEEIENLAKESWGQEYTWLNT
jgi:hypothetical protein